MRELKKKESRRAADAHSGRQNFYGACRLLPPPLALFAGSRGGSAHLTSRRTQLARKLVAGTAVRERSIDLGLDVTRLKT